MSALSSEPRPSEPRPSATGAVRTLVVGLRPWRRRFVAVLLTWVLVVLVTTGLGVAASTVHVLALLVAGATLSWYVLDHTAAHHVTVWPLVDGDVRAGNRGNDFRATSLAVRLEAANTKGEGREALVRDLHHQLCTVIRERLWARHQLVVEEEPRWAEGVTPPELWALLVSLPPPDLYRPERLDPILRRIEQW